MARPSKPYNPKYGMLTILEPPIGIGTKKTVLCICDCGNKKRVRFYDLRRKGSQATISCGCKAAKAIGERARTHGLSQIPEYDVYKNMMKRCYNPKMIFFANYGGRGITVCDRWRNSIADFIFDMGKRPTPKHTLERINNDGNYEPSNCRWATRKEQTRNYRRNVFLTFQGETKCLSEWCEKTGLGMGALFSRLKRGWPIERILTTPVNERKRNRFCKHPSTLLIIVD